MRGDGAQSATIATQITSGVGDQSIGVNLPRKTWTNSFGLERSEWGVGELITWNRALSQPEMQRTMDYFTRVLSGGTPYRQSVNTTVALYQHPTQMSCKQGGTWIRPAGEVALGLC